MATKTNDQYTANRERRKLRKIVEGAASESGYAPGQAGSIFSVKEDGSAPDARRLADKNDSDAYDKDFVRKVRSGLKAAGSNVSVADAVGAAQDHHESQIRRGLHGKNARASALGIAAPAEKQAKKGKKGGKRKPAAAAQPAAKAEKQGKRKPAAQPAAQPAAKATGRRRPSSIGEEASI